MEKRALFQEIIKALIEMDDEKVAELAEKTIELKIPAYETITDALIPGMDEVSRLYDEEEYFLPEVLMCSDAFHAGLNVVKPYINKTDMKETIQVVIGVVEGDTHDIGKNLVKILMDASDFEVYDLGRDVPLNKFIEKAEEVGADMICMSTLMTTTMDGMKVVIDRLSEMGIRDKYKILIGGGPISQHFADMIGADLYCKDASEAVKRARDIMGKARKYNEGA
jgi:dimethylamine corrinoid protein